MSRVCEEFSCLPSRARVEIENDDGTLLRILHMRAFAGAKKYMDDAARAEQEIESSPMTGEVMRLEVELLKQRRAERERKELEGSD